MSEKQFTSTKPESQAMVTVEGVELQRIEYREQPVLTLRQMDEVHGRPEDTAGRNFRQNKERLIEGEDYFQVPYDEWKAVVRRNSSDQGGGHSGPLTMLTKSGYLMLVKSFTDDRAWQVQRGHFGKCVMRFNNPEHSRALLIAFATVAGSGFLFGFALGLLF